MKILAKYTVANNNLAKCEHPTDVWASECPTCRALRAVAVLFCEIQCHQTGDRDPTKICHSLLMKRSRLQADLKERLESIPDTTVVTRLPLLSAYSLLRSTPDKSSIQDLESIGVSVRRSVTFLLSSKGGSLFFNGWGARLLTRV